MRLSEVVAHDLPFLYGELRDSDAIFKGKTIPVMFEDNYEIVSDREKVIKAMATDVEGISNADTITIGDIEYKVITFSKTNDGLEYIIGLDR